MTTFSHSSFTTCRLWYLRIVSSRKNPLKIQLHTNLCSLLLPSFSHFIQKVHAYDQCRAKINLKNCIHHACTEVTLLNLSSINIEIQIRASNLSGECNWWQELQRGNVAVVEGRGHCVKRYLPSVPFQIHTELFKTCWTLACRKSILQGRILPHTQREVIVIRTTQPKQ